MPIVEKMKSTQLTNQAKVEARERSKISYGTIKANGSIEDNELASAWDLVDAVQLSLYGRSGTGKCLGKGTLVLMYDGSTKTVENVEEGDILMGPGSKPRTVLSISSGVGPLYRIVPTKGDSWVCNDNHILTLAGSGHVDGRLKDISVTEYLADLYNEVPNCTSWKLVRSSGISFPFPNELPVPPYLVGLWMGDGSRGTCSLTNSKPEIRDYCISVASELGLVCRVTPIKNTYSIRFCLKEWKGREDGAIRDAKGKFAEGSEGHFLKKFFVNKCSAGTVKVIPQEYLTATKENRSNLLAGIIDTDGENTGVSSTSVTVTGEPYRDSLLFLARSLGFASYCHSSKVHVCDNGKVSTYYRISISGALSELPTKVKRFEARRQVKRVTVTGFEVEDEGDGEYFGFTVDGNGRFLLGDFTITHNSTLWATFPKPILAFICSGGNKPGELRSIDTPEYRKTITPYVVNQSTTIVDVIKRKGDQYATIVLDHASGLQDLVLKEILGLDDIPVQKTYGMAFQQDYGQCTLQVKQIIRDMLNCGKNMVIVAHERDFSKEDGTSSDIILPSVGSALMPQLTNWLNGAVDYICQTFIRRKEVVRKVKMGGKIVERREKTKEVEYCLRTAPDSVYMTRFRIPKGHKLPDVIVDPSYDKILAVIKGG